MAMRANDLGRRFLLDVCAAGSVSIRERGQQMREGLPVFSTDTREDAHMLQVRHCRLARDGSGVYFLNDPPEDASDLGRVSDLFRATLADAKADQPPRGQTPTGTSCDVCDDLGLVAEGTPAHDVPCPACATGPLEEVKVNDLREGTGTHRPRVRVLSINENDGDAVCILVRSGNKKTVRLMTLSRAYRLIQRNYGTAVAS